MSVIQAGNETRRRLHNLTIGLTVWYTIHSRWPDLASYYLLDVRDGLLDLVGFEHDSHGVTRIVL